MSQLWRCYYLFHNALRFTLVGQKQEKHLIPVQEHIYIFLENSSIQGFVN